MKVKRIFDISFFRSGDVGGGSYGHSANERGYFLIATSNPEVQASWTLSYGDSNVRSQRDAFRYHGFGVKAIELGVTVLRANVARVEAQGFGVCSRRRVRHRCPD